MIYFFQVILKILLGRHHFFVGPTTTQPTSAKSLTEKHRRPTVLGGEITWALQAFAVQSPRLLIPAASWWEFFHSKTRALGFGDHSNTRKKGWWRTPCFFGVDFLLKIGRYAEDMPMFLGWGGKNGKKGVQCKMM